jgi:hypothetical protein
LFPGWFCCGTREFTEPGGIAAVSTSGHIDVTAVLFGSKMINTDGAAMSPEQHHGHIEVDHLREVQHRCDIDAVRRQQSHPQQLAAGTARSPRC